MPDQTSAPRMYRVKNVSAEDFNEPWTKVTIKAGETVELEQLVAQRVISVFPYRAKLVVGGEKTKATKVKEVLAAPVAPKVEVDPGIPKIYKVKNTSEQDLTYVKTGTTIKAGQTSDELPQLEAQGFLSYFQGKTELIVELVQPKDEKPKDEPKK